MTPAPLETAELITRLRQQLILAQVRIMELEDERDLLSPRLKDIEALLTAAQQLADTKTGEAAHLTAVVADNQTHAAKLQALMDQSAAALMAAQAQLLQTQREATAARQAADETITSLRREIATMKATRSWRWTAWLR